MKLLTEFKTGSERRQMFGFCGDRNELPSSVQKSFLLQVILEA